MKPRTALLRPALVLNRPSVQKVPAVCMACLELGVTQCPSQGLDGWPRGHGACAQVTRILLVLNNGQWVDTCTLLQFFTLLLVTAYLICAPFIN